MVNKMRIGTVGFIFFMAVMLACAAGAQSPPSAINPPSPGITVTGPPTHPIGEVAAPVPNPSSGVGAATPYQGAAAATLPTGKANPITPQVAALMKDALDQEEAREKTALVAQGFDGNAILSFLALHPMLGTIAGLLGLIRFIGLPIHTALDRYLQKHLSPTRYAAVHTEGGAVFKWFDGIVNLVTSVKPSTVMAAASITKVAHPTVTSESNSTDMNALILKRAAEIVATSAQGQAGMVAEPIKPPAIPASEFVAIAGAGGTGMGK